MILGGVAQPGEWNREPNPATAAAIVARCVEVEPRIRDARIIGHRVGLRPTRPYIRVEEQQLGGARVIHNYGHGGAGVTLSWGCAIESAAVAAASGG
jgi:D-amino-acid oxidase